MSAIYAQITKIMTDLSAVSKSQKNKIQGFDFRGIDDVINELHPLLAKHGVFIVPEILEERRQERETKSGGISTFVIMKIKYSFYAEDGSHISAVMIGEAADSGDKASNKAQSIALKYACIQVFAIPTKDAKDQDEEIHEPAQVKSHKLIDDIRQWIYPFDYPAGMRGISLGDLGIDGQMKAGKSLADWQAKCEKDKKPFPKDAEDFLFALREMMKGLKR